VVALAAMMLMWEPYMPYRPCGCLCRGRSADGCGGCGSCGSRRTELYGANVLSEPMRSHVAALGLDPTAPAAAVATAGQAAAAATTTAAAALLYVWRDPCERLSTP
jgi:hypothetical protein